MNVDFFPQSRRLTSSYATPRRVAGVSTVAADAAAPVPVHVVPIESNARFQKPIRSYRKREITI